MFEIVNLDRGMYLVKYNYFNEGELDAKLQTAHSLQINTVVTYQKQLY